MEANSGTEGQRPDDWTEDFAEFVGAAHSRLHQGAIEYGNQSFHRPPGELLTELSQEALDLACWGFVLWRRIERIKENLPNG